MQATLAHFQDRFAQALRDPGAAAASDIGRLARHPGFAVYRNTVMKGWVDALVANYPAVSRLVGVEWLRAAAARYAREAPPCDARMLFYGERFADFLAGFEAAASLPYLRGVAQLDRLWIEAHAAPDEPALAPAQLGTLAPEALGQCMLRPHAAARWSWFDDQPIYTIWERNRSGLDMPAELEWHGEGALLVRPADAVAWVALDAAGCAFLDASAAGKCLAQAAHAALQVRPDCDIARLFSTLLEAGAFGCGDLFSPPHERNLA